MSASAFVFAACGSDEAARSGDIADVASETTPDVTSDTTPDVTSDTTPDVTSETTPDVTSAPDVTPETTPETTDTTPDPTIVAVPGTRCALSERSGLVELESSGDNFYLNATLDDRANPWYGPPALTSPDCAFHRFDPATACPPCAEDALCGLAGSCVPAPLHHADARITLSADGAEQVFAAEPTTGQIYGAVTLAGSTFAFEVTYGDTRITLAPTSPPGELMDLAGVLEGGYDAPTQLDLSWSTRATGTHAFTRIPINHHAGGPTFTECTVPAARGTMSVAEAMLAPLAVSTGLEFQGVEHVRFAAAQTAAGCVELRFTQRHFVNL